MFPIQHTTYTVETSWYPQPPGEMPFSGEASAPGGLKTWEQVKFTSDSCAPRAFQSKCLSGSEMGPSVCPAMTSCKRRPSNEREGQRLSKSKPFYMGASDGAFQGSAVKDSIWTVGGWWQRHSPKSYSCSKLQPPSKALPNDKVRFFVSHFIRYPVLLSVRVAVTNFDNLPSWPFLESLNIKEAYMGLL